MRNRFIFLICGLALILLNACTEKSLVDSSINEQSKALSSEKGMTTASSKESSLASNDPNMIILDENLLSMQFADMYLNPESYVGKIIKYEGIVQTDDHEDDSEDEKLDEEIARYVIRYGPGPNDSNLGLEVYWDKEYPQDGEWVEVVGELELVLQDGSNLLRVKLTSLTVMEERGKEYIRNFAK